VVYELLSDGGGQQSNMDFHQLYIVTRGQVEVVVLVGGTDQQVVAVYGVGQIFGPNLSLMNLNECTQIRCSKPTDVISLGASSLELLCRKFTTLEQAFSTCRELRSELGTNVHLRELWRGFETLTDIELEEIRALLTTEAYSVGVQVCRQGQEVDKLLLVARGDIEMEYGSCQDRYAPPCCDSQQSVSPCVR
jgi:signal-transduction protein with cAMP-binding, CBS, and nucleotidyltransferase domain